MAHTSLIRWRRILFIAFLPLVCEGVTASPTSASDGDDDSTFGLGTGVVTWGSANETIKAKDAMARSNGWILAVGSYDDPTQAPAVHLQAFDRAGGQLAAYGCHSTSPDLRCSVPRDPSRSRAGSAHSWGVDRLGWTSMGRARSWCS